MTTDIADIANITIVRLFEFIILVFGVVIPGVTIFILFPDSMPKTTSDLAFILYALAYSVPFIIIGFELGLLFFLKEETRTLIGITAILSILVFYLFVSLEYFSIITVIEQYYFYGGMAIAVLGVLLFLRHLFK